MLTGNKALHAFDRSQKIIENLEDTASRLRELTGAA